MIVRTKTIKAKDRTLGLKVSMSPAAAQSAAAGCDVAPTGLYWFSDSSGAFDQDSEAAYVLPEGAAGPLLGVAQLLGELCDAAVSWSSEWTPASGTAGAPAMVQDGAYLWVYPLSTAVAGVLSITATCDGKDYGPILLTVLQYACYSYGSSGGTSNNLGGWLRVPDNFLYASADGAVTQYGGADGAVLIGASTSTTLHFGNMPDVTTLWIYCNDGGGGYYIVNGDAVSRSPSRGTFVAPWQDGTVAVVSVAGITSLELHTDGYNAPWYLFVR